MMPYCIFIMLLWHNYCSEETKNNNVTVEMTNLRKLASHYSLIIPKTVFFNNQLHLFTFKTEGSLLFRGSVLRLLDLEAHDHCDLIDKLPFVRSHLCRNNVIPMIQRYTSILYVYSIPIRSSQWTWRVVATNR